MRIKASLFLIFSFLVWQNWQKPTLAQSRAGRFMSAEEKKARKKIYEDKIKSTSANIKKEMDDLKLFLKVLNEKYKGKTISYVINQYPFCDPKRKYWTKRQEVEVKITDSAITEVKFIITSRQQKNGYGFQKTIIVDKTPHDGNLEDMIIDYKDYLMPEYSLKQKIGDITSIASKYLVYEEIRVFYANLAKTMEMDYYAYLRSKQLGQREMMGRGAY